MAGHTFLLPSTCPTVRVSPVKGVRLSAGRTQQPLGNNGHGKSLARHHTANSSKHPRGNLQCVWSNNPWGPGPHGPCHKYPNSCSLYKKLPEDLVARVYQQTASGPAHVFFLDFEATGFPAVGQDFIELCVRHHTSGSTHTHLIKPRMKIDPVVIDKTQIDPTMVEDEELFDNRAGPLLEWILACMGPAGGVPLLVAHSGYQFDVPLLISQMARCGLVLPRSWLFFDTMFFHKHVLVNTLKYPGHEKSNLEAVHRQFGLQPRGLAHRAEADVIMLQEIAHAMAGPLTFGDAQELAVAVVEAEVGRGGGVVGPLQGKLLQVKLSKGSWAVTFKNKGIAGYAYQTLDYARTTLSKYKDEPWVKLLVGEYGDWIVQPRDPGKGRRRSS